jgi:hypothetical protein
MMVMASAFLIWQVPAMDFFDRLAEDSGAAARLLSISGFIIWATALLGWMMLGRIATRGASASVALALDDELVKANRSKAFLSGYIASLITSAAIFSVSLFQPVTGIEAAHLILIVSVVTPMYAFVFLERDRA